MREFHEEDQASIVDLENQTRPAYLQHIPQGWQKRDLRLDTLPQALHFKMGESVLASSELAIMNTSFRAMHYVFSNKLDKRQ
jgi:hypothetical protein